MLGECTSAALAEKELQTPFLSRCITVARDATNLHAIDHLIDDIQSRDLESSMTITVRAEHSRLARTTSYH